MILLLAIIRLVSIIVAFIKFIVKILFIPFELVPIGE